MTVVAPMTLPRFGDAPLGAASSFSDAASTEITLATTSRLFRAAPRVAGVVIATLLGLGLFFYIFSRLPCIQRALALEVTERGSDSPEFFARRGKEALLLSRTALGKAIQSQSRLEPADRPQDGACSICLDDFEELKDEEAANIPDVSRLPCEHEFHEKCLLGWAKRGKGLVCPLCDFPLTKLLQEKTETPAE